MGAFKAEKLLNGTTIGYCVHVKQPFMNNQLDH